MIPNAPMISELREAIFFIHDIIIEFFNFPFPGLGGISVGWLFLGGCGFVAIWKMFKLLFGGGDM